MIVLTSSDIKHAFCVLLCSHYEPLYLWSKRHSQASIVAQRSRSWWWCSSDCSCHCDRHGCVALCRCCVGDWKALFLLPASLQGCGDKGSHENGNLTRSAGKFKSWTRRHCCDDSLHLSALRCFECLMPILAYFAFLESGQLTLSPRFQLRWRRNLNKTQ